ncbi:MAG: autotransporter outer membrane beta-barrel domain-containing protein [Proteobacteria bacterium]|nr:autotransporter outer membrane beta-barrel domain-containing protein [Pseudomonadota bacterium]
MHPIARTTLAIAVAACLALPAYAQESGTAALTAQMGQVCAGAATGSALASRCATIFTSPVPNAVAIAADHNDLEEIPGAGRGAAKDQWPSRAEVDTLLTPKLALFVSVDRDHVARSIDDIEAAFDADTTTFTAGLDWHPMNRWQLGITLNRAHENQQFRGSEGRTQTDSTGVIGVTSFDLNEHFSLNGYFGRFWGSQDIRRVVSFVDNSAPVAETASPGVARTLGGVGLDANFAHGSWLWLGSLGFDGARTAIDGYTESGGSGFDLIVPNRSVKTQRGRLEVGLADTVSASWGVWQPQLRVGLIHEFSNDERTVGVRFVDDMSGTVVRFDTGAPDRDWAQATFSSTFTLPHGNSGFFSIGREFGHTTSTATTYAIGWRIEL